MSGLINTVWSFVLGIMFTTLVHADQRLTIEDFNNWKPAGNPYEGWAAGEITAGTTSCVVRAENFGGVYSYLGSLNAKSMDRFVLDVDVLMGNVGFVVVLEDADGTVHSWAWYGCQSANHVLTGYFNSPRNISKQGAEEGLDLSRLKGLHVQVDDGEGSKAYMVEFNDLSAFGDLTGAQAGHEPILLTYKTLRDIAYRDAPADDYMESRCKLDLYYPESHTGFPTVVWFHPGGLKRGNRYIPGELMNKGFAVASVDYRLAPEAKAPEYIEDAAAAVAWVLNKIERVGGDPNRVVVAGASAGGYLSLMVGLDKQWLKGHGIDADCLAGIVSLSGQAITHVAVREESGIDRKRPVIDQYAPLNHVRGDAPSIILVTGDRELELLGRYEENAYLMRMLKLTGHPNVELYEIKGKDHGGVERPGHAYLNEYMQNILKR